MDIVDKATEFIYKYATYKDKEKLRARVQKHYEYKTCRIFLDKDGEVCS